MGVKPTLHVQPTRAYTGSAWAIATSPVWTTIVMLALILGLGDFFTPFIALVAGFLLFVISVAFAIHDHKVLLDALHPKAASAWWMILSPFIYLLVRGIYVSRTVGRGWAPVIVFVICSIVPTAAALALSALITVFIALIP